MIGEEKLNSGLILGIVTLALVILAAWWYFGFRGAEIAPAPTVESAEDAIEAISKTSLEVESNPVAGKVPELNPVDKANPFKDSYKNPFE